MVEEITIEIVGQPVGIEIGRSYDFVWHMGHERTQSGRLVRLEAPFTLVVKAANGVLVRLSTRDLLNVVER